MATVSAPLWVDLEKLIAPVCEEQPEGESLRYEGTYDRIQESRRRDNPNLAQGVWETDLKQADWDTVIQLGVKALETRAKDLQIAAWLMEAWTHRYGFEGVKQGLEILFLLCEKFWDTAYPKIEDGDYEARVRPFEWINDKLMVQLKLIPLAAPKVQDHKNYTYSDYEIAFKNENLGRKSEEAKEKLGSQLNYAKFFTSCDLTPPDYYRKLAADVEEARDRLRNLEGYLDDRCGKQSPSLLGFRDTLRAISRLLNEIMERRGLGTEVSAPPEPQATAEPAEEATDFVNDESPDLGEGQEPEAAEGEPAAPAGQGPIRTRREAYRMLEEIADFLQHLEPHSPTPFLIRRAVSWGDMTLDQLLLEIVRDENDLRFIYELLGIRDENEPPQD